jgi:hypothetical protein
MAAGTAGPTASGGITRHIVVAHLMRTSLWPTDITEVPAAAPCPKGKRRPGRIPGRIQAISEEANSEAETRQGPQAPRISTAAPEVEAVTALEIVRSQAKAGAAAGAVAPFLVVPAGVPPAPAAPAARQAWDRVEAAVGVEGAGELVLSISREQESNTGCRKMREL